MKNKTLIIWLLVAFIGTNCLAQTPKWEKVAPGVWKTSIGTPENYNLLKAAGSKPALEGMAKMAQSGFSATSGKSDLFI